MLEKCDSWQADIMMLVTQAVPQASNQLSIYTIRPVSIHKNPGVVLFVHLLRKEERKYVVKWKWILNIQNNSNIYEILNTCKRLGNIHLSKLIEPYSTKSKTLMNAIKKNQFGCCGLHNGMHIVTKESNCVTDVWYNFIEGSERKFNLSKLENK